MAFLENLILTSTDNFLGSPKVNTVNVKQFLTWHYPLIGVLLGSLLIAGSMGTYTNWDAQLEYEATQNVAQVGFPYVSSGYMINQPPLGFYIAAPFSSSYLDGVYMSTTFGLGAVALVYVLGTVLYGRRTGIVASSLFGLVPWHVYMSRIFLIDNQCLFWSLLFLVFGVLAVKKNSQKFVTFAGIFFALAFLTKLFAVFALIPMFLIIIICRKKSPFKLTPKNIFMFLLPAIILQAIWYGGFAQQNFEAVYFSTDLYHPVLVDAPLEYLSTIYVNSAGNALFLATVVAMAVALVYKKRLNEFLRIDVICIFTIAVISGLNMLLVLGFHLTVPYVSVFKYTYFALPFFCIIAGSIADKAPLLLNSEDWKNKREWVKPTLIGIGFALALLSLLESIAFLNSWVSYASFGVDSVTYYPFNLYMDTPTPGLVPTMHYFGLVLVGVSVFLPVVFDKRKAATEKANTKLSDKNNPA
jgi:4-amino-4-deoxy-L-arabinose transferase-like glycosyltransferase